MEFGYCILANHFFLEIALKRELVGILNNETDHNIRQHIPPSAALKKSGCFPARGNTNRLGRWGSKRCVQQGQSLFACFMHILTHHLISMQ